MIQPLNKWQAGFSPRACAGYEKTERYYPVASRIHSDPCWECDLASETKFKSCLSSRKNRYVDTHLPKEKRSPVCACQVSLFSARKKQARNAPKRKKGGKPPHRFSQYHPHGQSESKDSMLTFLHNMTPQRKFLLLKKSFSTEINIINHPTKFMQVVHSCTRLHELSGL